MHIMMELAQIFGELQKDDTVKPDQRTSRGCSRTSSIYLLTICAHSYYST